MHPLHVHGIAFETWAKGQGAEVARKWQCMWQHVHASMCVSDVGFPGSWPHETVEATMCECLQSHAAMVDNGNILPFFLEGGGGGRHWLGRARAENVPTATKRKWSPL